METTTTVTTTTMSGDEFMAFMAGIAMIAIIFGLLAYVVGSYLLSRIFRKAGLDQWKAWVPVYNNWKTYELGGQQGWWAILMFVPVVNVAAAVFFYIAAYNIGLKLQKEGWFVILAIFLPVVWLAWLAFDKSTWKGAVSVPADYSTGEPPMPEGMSPFGTPAQPTPAPEASPAEAVPSDATVSPIEPLPAQPEPSAAPSEPTLMASDEVDVPQPIVQSPEMVTSTEPVPEVVSPTMPEADTAPAAPEASQPPVEYPSVDGILSPTEPVASAESPDQQSNEPNSSPNQPQPPVPPAQQ